MFFNKNSNPKGAFVVSKNILKNIPVKYSFKKSISNKNLNGWTLFSAEDENIEGYIQDESNYVFLDFETVYEFLPMTEVLVELPDGTDYGWIYNDNNEFEAFYDLKQNKVVTVEELKTK